MILSFFLFNLTQSFLASCVILDTSFKCINFRILFNISPRHNNFLLFVRITLWHSFWVSLFYVQPFCSQSRASVGNSWSLKCAWYRDMFSLSAKHTDCVHAWMSFCSCLQVKHGHCLPRFHMATLSTWAWSPSSSSSACSTEPPPDFQRRFSQLPRACFAHCVKARPSSLTPSPGDGTLDLLPHCFQRGWMRSRLCWCDPPLNSCTICWLRDSGLQAGIFLRLCKLWKELSQGGFLNRVSNCSSRVLCCPLHPTPPPLTSPTQPAGCVQDERSSLCVFTGPEATGSPCPQTNAALSGIVGTVSVCVCVCLCLKGEWVFEYKNASSGRGQRPRLGGHLSNISAFHIKALLVQPVCAAFKEHHG